MSIRKILQRTLGLTLTILSLAGCGGTQATPTPTPVPPTDTPVPPTATPTPVPSISGILKPWADDDPIADRQVIPCQIIGDTRELPADCVLIDSVTTSDDQGNFQFSELPPGAYFILYDSGVGDFDGTLQRWRGQTLKLGDVGWLADEYFIPDTEGKCSVHIPSGFSLMLDMEAYVVATLLFCDSPFILAHDVEKTFSDKALELVVVDVSEEQTGEVEFQVMYFGD